MFGVAGEVLRSVFDGLFVAAEGVADAGFFAVPSLIGAIVSALCGL